LVVGRTDFVVTVAEFDEARFRLLAALRAGTPVGRAGRDAGLDPGRTDACLRAWTAEGLIVGINGRTSHR
jgi:hypothetical protein